MSMTVSFTTTSEITATQDQLERAKLILNYNNATNPAKKQFQIQLVYNETLTRSMSKHKTSINVKQELKNLNYLSKLNHLKPL